MQVVTRSLKWVSGRLEDPGPEGPDAAGPAAAPAKPIDKVVRRVKDTTAKDVTWLIYEKMFVARSEGERIRNFEAFVSNRDLEGITVNGVDFSAASVWVATDRGAFCYERGNDAWVEYAVNREFIGEPVSGIEVRPDGSIAFDMGIKGKRKTYVLDPAVPSWRAAD